MLVGKTDRNGPLGKHRCSPNDIIMLLKIREVGVFIGFWAVRLSNRNSSMVFLMITSGLRTSLFWVFTQCWFVSVHRRFGTALKMYATGCPRISINYQQTLCNNPEEQWPHLHSGEDLKLTLGFIQRHRISRPSREYLILKNCSPWH
jgi:hypothetical protein